MLIDLDEQHKVLKSFAKYKSPWPDGWTVEFFIHFFDLVCMELLNMAEAFQKNGNIPRAINSTFIALIPKKYESDTFMDFRPISLCNITYKLILKIIAKCLKSTLSIHTSEEKYGFLQNRLVHDAVATTQECLHSIHMRKMEAIFMKADLKKYYDSIYWAFL